MLGLSNKTEAATVSADFQHALMRQVMRTELIRVKALIGTAAFITIVQLIAILTPDWRSPTQGVPVLYTLTFNALQTYANGEVVRWIGPEGSDNPRRRCP